MQQNAIGFSITVAVLALSPPRGSFLGVYYRSPVTLIYNMLMDEYIFTSLLCLTESPGDVVHDKTTVPESNTDE